MEMFAEFSSLLQGGGWIAVAAMAIYLSYKTSLVAIIAVSIYRAVKLLVTAYTSKTLEDRIAAEIGTKAPLTAGEEAAVLSAVRAGVKNVSSQ